MTAKVRLIQYDQNSDIHGLYVSVPEKDLKVLTSEYLCCAVCRCSIVRPRFYVYACMQLIVADRQIKFDVVCKECSIPIENVISTLRARAREEEKQARSNQEKEAATHAGGVS